MELPTVRPWAETCARWFQGRPRSRIGAYTEAIPFVDHRILLCLFPWRTDTRFQVAEHDSRCPKKFGGLLTVETAEVVTTLLLFARPSRRLTEHRSSDGFADPGSRKGVVTRWRFKKSSMRLSISVPFWVSSFFFLLNPIGIPGHLSALAWRGQSYACFTGPCTVSYSFGIRRATIDGIFACSIGEIWNDEHRLLVREAEPARASCDRVKPDLVPAKSPESLRMNPNRRLAVGD
jgi:hypothetical protein